MAKKNVLPTREQNGWFNGHATIIDRECVDCNPSCGVLRVVYANTNDVCEQQTKELFAISKGLTLEELVEAEKEVREMLDKFLQVMSDELPVSPDTDDDDPWKVIFGDEPDYLN